MDLRYFIGLASRAIEAGEGLTGIGYAGREVIPIGCM
jgi:hypothetical protein